MLVWCRLCCIGWTPRHATPHQHSTTPHHTRHTPRRAGAGLGRPGHQARPARPRPSHAHLREIQWKTVVENQKFRGIYNIRVSVPVVWIIAVMSISILLSTMFWTKNHWTVQNTLNGANPLGVTGDWVKEESRFLNPLSFFTSFLILWSDWALVFKVCCCQSVRLLHCGSFSKVLPDMYCFVSLPSPFYISSLRR